MLFFSRKQARRHRQNKETTEMSNTKEEPGRKGMEKTMLTMKNWLFLYRFFCHFSILFRICVRCTLVLYVPLTYPFLNGQFFMHLPHLSDKVWYPKQQKRQHHRRKTKPARLFGLGKKMDGLGEVCLVGRAQFEIIDRKKRVIRTITCIIHWDVFTRRKSKENYNFFFTLATYTFSLFQY